MRIDSYAHGNRWRQIHPGVKGLLVLLTLIAALLSRHPTIPLLIALSISSLTLFGAGIPWRGYLRLLAVPLVFLGWSSLLLLVTFSPTSLPLLQLPASELTIGLNLSELPLVQLVFSRSLGALCTLLFFALTTPLSEIAGLLRTLGLPRLFVELMVIAYRQIFILLDAFSQIHTAQEARLGYRSFKVSWRSTAELAGNILIKTIVRARHNHQALLARGYDQELRFLSPHRHLSRWQLLGAGTLGWTFILLAWQVQP
ncbi:MAG: cobalt ECF transporter T component CbiQ [Deltaproteobacteria bacterium HGW-Deltaproteobacteria-4]|nr:MAG: cobalt ECF transporter T component CbiQ [Deltaproteobacteria bacterium HGW-Deltaproteobacteria-4]